MTKRKRKGLPPVSILSAEFKYVPEAESDIRVTFARIKREAAEKKAAEAEVEQRKVVRKIVWGGK